MNYKVVLAYDGTRYDGWQKQGNTDKTIQGRLEAVLSRLAEEPVEVHGSGRTDRGVHAEGQVANFHIKESVLRKKLGEKISLSEALKDYMNHYLPEDIGVLSCEEAGERFHSRLSAVRKTYRYQIEQSTKKDVFTRHYYYGLGRKLELRAMEQAAAALIGTHDFKSFCGNKKMKKSTVRTLESIRIEELEGGRLHIFYTGNGFLQQMVRILTGTLIQVGLGEIKPEEMNRILEAGDRQAAGFTAPAQGLFLENVEYGEER